MCSNTGLVQDQCKSVFRSAYGCDKNPIAPKNVSEVFDDVSGVKEHQWTCPRTGMYSLGMKTNKGWNRNIIDRSGYCKTSNQGDMKISQFNKSARIKLALA